MKPAEDNIDLERSDFYVHAPTTVGERTFFYVLRAGVFSYQPGYEVYRASFNSFLLMHVLSGGLTADLDGTRLEVGQGQFCLIDCYAPHSYSAAVRSRVAWMHFDGPDARAYYRYIVARRGNVFTLPNPDIADRVLSTLIDAMARSRVVSEPEMGRQVVTLLTQLADDRYVTRRNDAPRAIEEVLSYISSHFSQEITVPQLAARTYMSEYHFIRVFSREVGLTPHAYITRMRVRTAEYMLVNGSADISDISKKCGFSSTTVMGAAFRRLVGMSPTQYRQANSPHRDTAEKGV